MKVDKLFVKVNFEINILKKLKKFVQLILIFKKNIII
jgi:hypothetical protein